MHMCTYVYKADLKTAGVPSSALCALGIQVCTAMPRPVISECLDCSLQGSPCPRPVQGLGDVSCVLRMGEETLVCAVQG